MPGDLTANVALQAALKGMQAALGEVCAKGYMGRRKTCSPISQRQRLAQKDEFDVLEHKYSTKDQSVSRRRPRAVPRRDDY